MTDCRKDICFMNVLDKIEKLMVANDMTATELAKRAGLPSSTVSTLFSKRWEPRIKTLEKLCSVFNLSLSEFFQEDIASNEPKLIEIKYKKLSEKRQAIIRELIEELLK